MNEIYRECASVVLLRPANVCSPDGCGTVYQVLLVHKPRKNDAWQLPQGGVEPGESLEEAAARELHEEAGLDAEALGKSEKTYQYDFPPEFRKAHPDNVIGQRVSYVFAKAGSDVQVQVDEHEIDTYAWVLPEDLGNYIKREEYLALVQELVTEGRNAIDN